MFIEYLRLSRWHAFQLLHTVYIIRRHWSVDVDDVASNKSTFVCMNNTIATNVKSEKVNKRMMWSSVNMKKSVSKIPEWVTVWCDIATANKRTSQYKIKNHILKYLQNHTHILTCMRAQIVVRLSHELTPQSDLTLISRRWMDGWMLLSLELPHLTWIKFLMRFFLLY